MDNMKRLTRIEASIVKERMLFVNSGFRKQRRLIEDEKGRC